MIKGIGWGSRVDKTYFFILRNVLVLPLCFPKWDHLSPNSYYCRSYGAKRNDD